MISFKEWAQFNEGRKDIPAAKIIEGLSAIEEHYGPGNITIAQSLIWHREGAKRNPPLEEQLQSLGWVWIPFPNKDQEGYFYFET
jgi:hypothetical protein